MARFAAVGAGRMGRGIAIAFAYVYSRWMARVIGPGSPLPIA